MATFARTEDASYWTNAAPSSLVCEVETDIDLATVTSTTAELHDPTGVVVLGTTATLDAGADPPTIAVAFPADPFVLGGIYSVWLLLTGPGFVEPVEPVQLVVQTPDGWLTLEQARGLWPLAPTDDETLYMLLDAAKAACVAFAPAIVEGAGIPQSYRQAQFQQARSTWLAMSATTDSRIGDEGFAVTVFPLDWNVKQLLRPRGAPILW